MRYIIKNKNAFALPIVMWIVAALLLGITFIITLSKDNISLTQSVNNKLKARIIAENYLEVLEYYVLTANYDSLKLINNVKFKNYELPKEIFLDGREYNSSNVSYSLRDTSMMLNVLSPDTQMIAKLANIKMYNSLNDSLLDWVDMDDKVRLNGAEESYYEKNQQVNYKPRNFSAIQSVDELKLVKGFASLKSKSFKRLKRYLYFSSNGSNVNLALIDAYYLSRLLKINIYTAQELEKLKMKDYRKFQKYIQNLKSYNDGYMGFALSKQIKFSIQVKIGMSRVLLNTIIDFRRNILNHILVESYEVY